MERLKFRLDILKEISVEDMLGCMKHGEAPEGGEVLGLKRKVYEQVVRYLRIEGNPTEADPDYKEANINHLVFSIISPILEQVALTTRENVRLQSQKEIVSTDGKTGGTQEVVVVDRITYNKEKFILVVESKRSSLGQALKQCLLALKDMRDNNGDGKVYGFLTTGTLWQMVEYDGRSFRLTEKMIALFGGMDEDEARWMRKHSTIVDCLKFALDNGDR